MTDNTLTGFWLSGKSNAMKTAIYRQDIRFRSRAQGPVHQASAWWNIAEFFEHVRQIRRAMEK